MKPHYLALPLLLSAFGCGGHNAAHPVLPALPKVSVRTVLAVDSAHDVGDEVVGTVRSKTVAEVSSSVMGTVRNLNVAIGRRVRVGEVLVQLSAGEIDAKAEQARAMHARAKIDLDRASQLMAAKSIPTAQFDVAAAQFRVAEATLAEAEVMRGYTQIRAPIAGVITAKQVGVGDLAVPGKALFIIESPDHMRLEAAVPEALAQHIALGMHMQVHLDALNKSVEGSVSELAPAADPQSRTALIKLDLPADPALRPGMFGRLSVGTGEAKALTVPDTAIVRRGQLETLYVVEDGKAVLRIVRTSERTLDGKLEVYAGLHVGEHVVVGRPVHLTDGQPVEETP
jgi:membrane fusion protein (multidrug efflux system)